MPTYSIYVPSRSGVSVTHYYTASTLNMNIFDRTLVFLDKTRGKGEYTNRGLYIKSPRINPRLPTRNGKKTEATLYNCCLRSNTATPDEEAQYIGSETLGTFLLKPVVGVAAFSSTFTFQIHSIRFCEAGTLPFKVPNSWPTTTTAHFRRMAHLRLSP